MLRYFIAANLWLFLAALVFVGKTTMRHEPVLYAVFGVGQWFYGSTYSLLIIVPAVHAIIYYVLWLKTSKRDKSQTTHQ